jgi:hypothetical protein
MGLVGDDFNNGASQDLFWRCDAELHAHNRHCILICCPSNIFYDPFSTNIYGL